MRNLKLKISPESATRIRELPISRFVPNILTISAICAGFSSIKFALSSQLESSMFCILIAVLLDGTDGRVARLLHKESHFGAELDSLADFLNFGVAPSLIAYLVSLSRFSQIGWALVMFSAICCALRLARFNTLKFYDDSVDEADKPEFESNYSVGVAAPAGALLIVTPILFYLATENISFLSPLYLAISTLFGGLLMISHLRTFVFKKVKVTPYRAPLFLLAFCLSVIALVTALWETMCVIVLLYIVSIPISDRMYWRKVKMFSENK